MENYHKHTDFSNIGLADSPSAIEEYAKRTIELGGHCLFSGEHGNQGNAYETYLVAEKYGLKYVHSTESYWVKDRLEQDNTNCHMMIVALNNEGRREINYMLSMANIDGYYYRPRIDLALLLKANPNNIIVTSACIAGWKYEDADEIWLRIADHFGENFFFEIQTHNVEKQIKLNEKILDLSIKNNIKMIVGLDSHYIYDKDDIRREQILKYKKVKYPDEEGWYIDYPDANTVYNRLKEQNVFTEEQIIEAINNTNIFNDKCENIIFDKHFKIPILYKDKSYEERTNILKNILNAKYKDEPLKSKEKIDGIRWEVEQIVDSGVMDYFLTNEKIIRDAIENEGGVLTTTSRGSSASFIINKLLGFTTIDRFNSEIPIYPERFLTKERVRAGQMPDIDFNIAQQEPFIKASRKVVGEHGCYPLMAVEMLKEKAAWQLYAGANGIEPQIANEVSKHIDEYNEAIKYIDDEEEKNNVDIIDYIPNEYVSIYKESKDYQNTIINLKVHACGYLLFDGDIRKEIGLISAVSRTTGKRTLCAAIEGKHLDDFGYVKNDYLIVDSVDLIHKCFDSIGREVPSFDELREMIKGDNLTWSIYKNGITQCINQIEKENTTNRAKAYKPTDLAELSAFIAGIRPGFSSLLPKFIKRESYTTGEFKIDEILEDSFHYMIYQESIMKVLSFLGQPMTETYGVIKSISKKKLKGEKKDILKKSLIEYWTKIFGNTDNFEEVWKVIEDSARYSFNAPHALSMAGDSAYLAWFKSHHTSKFYETSINHYLSKDNKDKINALMRESSQFYGYSIKAPKFGGDYSTAIVNDKEKIIDTALISIKGIQSITNDILIQISNRNPQTFLDVLQLIEEVKVDGKKLNKKSLEILIKIGFFEKFGTMQKLIATTHWFNELGKKKTIKKDKIDDWLIDIVREHCEKETEKQFSKIDGIGIVKDIIDKLPHKDEDMFALIKNQVKHLGYADVDKMDISPNVYILQKYEKDSWGRTWVTIYQILSGESATYKLDKTFAKTHKPVVNDIIKCVFGSEPVYKKVDGNWQKTPDVRPIVKFFSYIEKNA